MTRTRRWRAGPGAPLCFILQRWDVTLRMLLKNLKVTFPEDVAIAEAILARRG